MNTSDVVIHMRALVLCCIALLVLSPVLAEEYWAVVREDGTTQDVVNAANFAASMKGSVATTFESRTDEQIIEADPEFDEVLAVLFEGDDLIVMQGDDPAFQRVVDNIVVYAQNQGFDVEFESGEDVFPQPEQIEVPEPVEELPEVDDEVIVQEEPEPAPPPAYESEPQPAPERPNVFVRVWRWFAGIFS